VSYNGPGKVEALIFLSFSLLLMQADINESNSKEHAIKLLVIAVLEDIQQTSIQKVEYYCFRLFLANDFIHFSRWRGSSSLLSSLNVFKNQVSVVIYYY